MTTSDTPARRSSSHPAHRTEEVVVLSGFTNRLHAAAVIDQLRRVFTEIASDVQANLLPLSPEELAKLTPRLEDIPQVAQHYTRPGILPSLEHTPAKAPARRMMEELIERLPPGRIAQRAIQANQDRTMKDITPKA